MGRRRDKASEEEPAGAPAWMLTYSDCMTLLLTFFVLLITFATFQNEAVEELGASFAHALPSVGLSLSGKNESIRERPQVVETERPDKGSETPTQAKTATDNFMTERRPLDFRNLKVFTIPSDDFFFGRGEVVSPQGRMVLDKLAEFLLAQRSRVVVSENGPDANPEMGLERAWAVVEYLSAREGLEKNMFSVAASSTVRYKRSGRRMLEITLLEREIYE